MNATEIEARVAERRALIDGAAHARLDQVAAIQEWAGQYVEPCSKAYEDLTDALSSADTRIRLGLGEIDIRTRGFGAKELILILGFAHAGKTQLLNTMFLNNLDKRTLFFSMDDPKEMILLKLACMHRGESAEDVERRLRQGDETLKRELRAFATEQLRNLVIVDQSMGLGQMAKVVDEATRYWGAEPELCAIDYLGSVRGAHHDDEGDSIKAKADALKAWVKDKPFPTVCLHQNTRGKGAPGEPITMLSGAYGGEQEATMVIGIRRKRDWKELTDFERKDHEHTVTLHVAKNKRPPGKVTPPEGIDFWMEPDTGLIRPLRDADLMRVGLPMTAEQAVRAAKGTVLAQEFDGTTRVYDEVF